MSAGYVAIHYVRVDGALYTPGEVINADIPEEKEKRLLEKGAIRKTGASFSDPCIPVPDDSLVLPEPEKQPDSAEETATEEADEETEMEDAPVIDVSDGIIAEPEADEEKPKAKKSARRNAK